MEVEISYKRKAKVCCIQQWYTYDSLIEGIPNRRFNAHLIKSDLDKLKLEWGDIPVYFIKPSEGKVSNYINRRGEEHFEIPKVTSIIWLRLEDFNSALNNTCLVILWYQKELNGRIEESILEQIKKINWELESIKWVK